MPIKLRIGSLIMVLVSIINVALSEAVTRPRGVSLTNEPFYHDKEWFTCLDGSRQIFKSHVNDDYCDCGDASDEPGTSACPRGSFYCNNKGHKPMYIPSSRVNDGICDCCDASDEYQGKGATKCINNCRELGRVELERRQQEIVLMNQGYDIRQRYIKEGAEKKVEREESLKKLQEQKGVVDLVKDEKEKLKQVAEAPEKEAKDVHKAQWDAQQEVLKVERENQRASDAFEELDANGDERVTPDELKDHKEFDTNDDGEVSEEEATVVLGGVENVLKDLFTGPVWDVIKDKFKSRNQPIPEEIPPPPVDEGIPVEDRDEAEFGDPENEEDFPEEDDEIDEDEDDDDDEFDDDMDQEELMTKYGKNRAEFEKKEKIKDEGGEEMTEYDEETKKLIEVADKAREEFTEAENRVNDVKRSIEDLEKLLRVDLGPQQEFEPLQKQCYEYTDREYVYKFCAFDRVTQRPKSGGSETALGNWGQWDGPQENLYSKMKYTKGRNCWNGPDRSTMVILRCGTENKVLSASEPERCVYQLEFETPALCTTKIDPQTGESDTHDEL